MHRKKFYYVTLIVGITAALTVAFTLKLSRSGSATPVPPAADAPLLARATTPADEYKGAQQEGIKVHGHWTIDVRNPDGTLVTHREFENALTADGAQTLSLILARSLPPDFWKVLLASNTASPWSNSQPGVIAELHDPVPLAPNVSKNLSLCLGGGPCTIAGVPQPTPPEGSFLLGGSIPAQQNGTIDKVVTTQNSLQFTAHPLAPLVNGSCPPNTQCVVNVVGGQIVQVTVIISFS